jgi:cytochrome P450 / NADPH-cytochrome P450 reductase
MCTYEHPDGRVEKLSLSETIRFLLEDTVNRIRQIFFLLFAELNGYPLTPMCRRYLRNATSIRNALQVIIDERRAGKTSSTFGDQDLLSLLLSSEMYKGNDEKTKDELIIFFIAGNDTIRTSSANTVCYLAMNPDAKTRFMNEIEPILNSASEDFISMLNEEEVDKFTYVRYCWQESMRLNPPLGVSSTNIFRNPVSVKGIDFTPDIPFAINFDAIHKDPQEWVDPLKFIPERFDASSPMFKRPDGKPRNPFSFCPFFGGKRICLGKTLAEFMTVYTLPLVLYHFDFEFVDPAHKLNKPTFQLATTAQPVIPMRIKTIRAMKL